MAEKEDKGLFTQAGDIAGAVWDQMSMLDKAAIATSFIPVVGDVVGGVADATNWYNKPEDRTLGNAALIAAGLLPWVPPAASKRAWEMTVQNMPNDLKGFYSGPLGQVSEIARTSAHGATNALKQAITPKGQSLWRKERISKTLQNELKKNVDKLPKAQKKLDDAIKGGDKEVIQAARKEQTRLAKVIEGQKSQHYLLGEQYGNQAKALDLASRGSHIGSGNFDVTDFSRMVEEVSSVPKGDSDLLFKAIGQLQQTAPGVGKMVMKRAKSGLGAGDLTGVVARGPRFKQVKEMFSQRPTMKSFGSYKKFEEALTTGASKAQKEKLVKGDALVKLKKAFHGNKELSEASSIQEFSKALKKAKVKLTPTQVKHAFKKLPKQGFKDNKELIKALEDKGIDIMNKEKALAGDPVLIQNHLATGAFELGNANVVTVVRPNGSSVSIVNDKNDLASVNAPFGGNMITVSTPVEINLAGGVPGKLAQRRTKAFNQSEFQKTEDAAKAVQREYGVDPFALSSPHQNVAQKASTQAIINAAPKPSLRDYGNAAGTAAYLGGSGALRSGLFTARQNRED